MWNKLRTSISTPRDPLSSREVGYTAIGTNDDPLESTSPINSPRASAAVSHQRGVYWAFWILGAGVLLAWNGQSSLLCPTTTDEVVLICTMPLLSSFFMEEDPHRTNLASWLSSVYCFGNLFFLGLAQRDAGRVSNFSCKSRDHSDLQMSPSSALRSSLVLLFILSLLMAFPLTPILLPALSSNTLLFPLLIILTLLLALSTAILQWAVFALASLWGSQEMLGVMSGQGGIAVLVSGAQVFLAIFSALGTGGGETAGQSRMAGVGLWALGAIGAGVCMAAHRFLVRHPEYEKVMEPLYIRQDGNERKNGSEISRKVFKKNILLEIAVAWVFVVTLVCNPSSHNSVDGLRKSVFPPITSRILSVDTTPGAFHQPSVFIPVHFLLFNSTFNAVSPWVMLTRKSATM